MSLEIDHVFCFCEPLLSEVQTLESNGFVLSEGYKHQGQGTANRCLLFESNYLELIYLDSKDEALTNPLELHLRANWKTTGACPFGIALRGEIPTQNLSDFWDYSPPYNPTRIIKIHRFSKEHPEFPLLFVMPSSGTSPLSKVRLKNFLPHQSESTTISRIKMNIPLISWPLNTEIQGLSFEKSLTYKMEVQINGNPLNSIKLNELLNLVIK